MNVSRKFEKQGPLWVPHYDVDTPGRRYERYRERQRIKRIVMAIAFSQVGTRQGASPTSDVITIAAGVTVVVTITLNADSVSTVTDDGGSIYSRKSAITNADTFTVTELWSTIAGGAKAATTILVTSKGGGSMGVAAATYTGVVAVGIVAIPTQGSSTAPSISLTTQDANNFIVAGMGSRASVTSTWAAATGNLRGSLGGGLGNSGTAIMDNTRATVGSVTCAATLSATGPWNATAIELKTVAAKVFEDDPWKPAKQNLPEPIITVW
jgi:hypothetical protein